MVMARKQTARKEAVEPISIDFAPATLAQLKLAALTRGAALHDGRITDPDALIWLAASRARYEVHAGHPWLKRRGHPDVPRLLDGSIPWELFLPRIRGVVDGVVYLVYRVFDTAAYITIPSTPRDPRGVFSRPVPAAATLTVEEALGISGLTYHALDTRRRIDALLQDAIVRVGGGAISYKTREYLAWLHHRGIEATPIP
jgi:hypothetical protein